MAVACPCVKPDPKFEVGKCLRRSSSPDVRCGGRRRDAVSMFMLRNTQRAAKRGYAVAASAASLEVNGEPARPVHYVVS